MSIELSVRTSVNTKPRAIRTGYHRLAPIILFITDYLTVVLGLIAAYYFREYILRAFIPTLGKTAMHADLIYGMVPLIYMGFIYYEGLYTKRLPFWQGAQCMFKACFFANLLIIGVIYFLKVSDHVSRSYFFVSWLFILSLLFIQRYMSKRLLAKLGIWQKPIIVIGAGKTAEILAMAFEDPYLGYKLVGVIEDYKEERPLTWRYPWLGGFADAVDRIKTYGVKEVIIAAPGLERQALIDLIYTCQPYVENITIVPNLFGVPLSNVEVDTLFNEKTLLIRLRNNMMRSYNRIFKRLFDWVVTLIGLIFMLPILAIIAALIYIESPGPVIFTHTRVGRNGVPFPCYKFRTMVKNAQEILKDYLANNPSAKEEWQRDFKLKNDPRITRVGEFLRKTSLDELPQLLNVLKGEMSLVGPRPIVIEEIEKYGNSIKDYYLVSPGITGYWQVSGRNDVDYDTRVQMDTWYVRNWSMWLDIVLLLKTVNVVVHRKGAY